MNTHIRPVVVGVLEVQEAALAVAVRYARDARTSLRIVHAIRLAQEEALIGAGQDPLKDLHAAGHSVLDDVRAHLEETAPDVDATYMLSGRTPLAVLEEEAASALMLVVGVDDVVWFERELRTRTAGHLARRAPCPVVIVPEGTYFGEAMDEALVTLDGVSPSAGPIRFALESVDDKSGHLNVLHVAPPGTSPEETEAARVKISEELDGWRRAFPHVTISSSSSQVEARSSLAEAARSAGLVIVGRPHSHIVPWTLSRAPAANLLRMAQCPVAVVPDAFGGF